MDDLLDLAVDVAHHAGALLLDGLDRVRTTVDTKSTRTDMVTEMDHASERLIATALREARPHDGFLGEEGTSTAGSTGVRWVFDPLDGTTNYLYGIPAWCVSIAAEVDGSTAVGVVHDPVHAETFTALRGSGAWCNGQGLHVSGAPEPATALVATGFAYDALERGRQAALLARVLPAVRDVRRVGAAALDLAWVALGRVDAFYERGLMPWDRAAGSLIAAEAGAVVETLDDGTHLAAPPQLYEPLRALLAAADDLTGRGPVA
ncbi:MAG TPA: inositol monophosphatase family protein [Acidimicrobiales bacterium]|nr:inositol monophosphatase family protein [Acidimicrobiales bacterium]